MIKCTHGYLYLYLRENLLLQFSSNINIDFEDAYLCHLNTSALYLYLNTLFILSKKPRTTVMLLVVHQDCCKPSEYTLFPKQMN